MLKIITISFCRFNALLEKRLASSLQFARPLAWAAFFGFPIFFVLLFKTEHLWANGLGFLISILTLLTSYSIIIHKKYLPIVWCLYLICAFPLNLIYGFFTNPTDPNYIVGVTMGLMVLTIIISNLFMLLMILLLGILLSMIIYYPGSYHLILHQLIGNKLLFVYLLALVFSIILVRKRIATENLYHSLKDKLQGMMSLSYSMAHELNTPLVVIKLSANNLKKFYPELIAGYQLAKQAKLPVPEIPSDLLPLMQQTLDTIETDAEAAISITQILLMNVQGDKEQQNTLQPVSMYACIKQVLEHYPYRSTFDKKRIHWQKSKDFTFLGNQLLMTHVFFNLLKNAIQAILQISKGEIEIYNDTYANSNYVYFKDTGKGIKKKELTHLFDGFYSTHKEGLGLGLYFCKNTLESFSGNISCDSIEGKYTTFVLRLPKAN